MSNPLITDARTRIEKVVADYRNDETRTNFQWAVKKSHCYAEEVYLVFAALGFSGLYFQDSSGNYIDGLMSKLAVIVSLSFFIYWSATRLFKRFKEKVWEFDLVSEEDILYLCSNSGLKDVIKDAIKKDHQLTYTSLVERTDMYLCDMQKIYNKKMQENLLEKIRQL